MEIKICKHKWQLLEEDVEFGGPGVRRLEECVKCGLQRETISSEAGKSQKIIPQKK